MNFGFREHMAKLAKDKRLKRMHICLYMSIYHVWVFHGDADSVQTCGRDIREVGRIGSNSTYHKYLKDLITFGYISYVPSYDPGKKTTITILRFPDEETEENDKNR